MLKNLIGILALALMLSPAVALAGNYSWDGVGAPDLGWNQGLNWIGGNKPPLNTDWAFLNGTRTTGYSPLTLVYTSEWIQQVSVGTGQSTAEMNAGQNDHTLRILNEGVLTTYAKGYGNCVYVACNSSKEGTIHGYVEVYTGGLITNVWNAAGSPGATQYGLSLTWPNGACPMTKPVNPETWQSNTCIGRLDMLGGTVDVFGRFAISRGYGGASANQSNDRGAAYLTSGSIYAGDLLMYFNHYADTYGVGGDPLQPRWVENTTPDYMDITGGVLYLLGDDQATVQGYIDNGWIEGFGGAGVVRMALVDLTGQGHKAGDGTYTKIWAEIPEPGTMLLAGFGVLLLLVTRRKR